MVQAEPPVVEGHSLFSQQSDDPRVHSKDVVHRSCPLGRGRLVRHPDQEIAGVPEAAKRLDHAGKKPNVFATKR